MTDKRNIEMVRKYSHNAQQFAKQSYKKIIPLALVVCITLGISYFSYNVGYAIGTHQFRNFVDSQLVSVEEGDEFDSMQQTVELNDVDFAPFWDAWVLLEQNFVQGANGSSTTEYSDQDHVWGAIKGLAASYGDPFTTFLPPEENESFEADISGEFSGVGMEIGNRNGVLTVISPLPGTPADKAGMRPKDVIAKIDGVDSLDMSATQAVKLIRGPRGEEVTLTVYRASEPQPLEISITRDLIHVPIIDGQKVDGVYVIKLFSFTSSSAKLFAQEIDKFKASGADKLIIDFRGNPGGYLEAAIDIASRFLDKDAVVVTEQYSDKRLNKQRYSYGYNNFSDDMRIIVLVNGGSASASEIVAGALRDHDQALIVGQTSFGKGSVQELFQLTKDTSLKITIAKWLTPSGKHISQNGITPDIELAPYTPSEDEQKEAGTYNKDFGQDHEIQEAVKIISRDDFFELFDEIPEELQSLSQEQTD